MNEKSKTTGRRGVWDGVSETSWERSDDSVSEGAFLEMVESAWHELTGGEIDLVSEETGLPFTADEAPEAPLALAMRDEVERFTTVFDVPADDIETTSDRAVADRVAAALQILWHGADVAGRRLSEEWSK